MAPCRRADRRLCRLAPGPTQTDHEKFRSRPVLGSLAVTAAVPIAMLVFEGLLPSAISRSGAVKHHPSRGRSGGRALGRSAILARCRSHWGRCRRRDPNRRKPEPFSDGNRRRWPGESGLGSRICAATALAAFLSVGLALTNLLPTALPLLDGGAMLVALAELLCRRPPSPAAIALANRAWAAVSALLSRDCMICSADSRRLPQSISKIGR